MVRGLDRTKPEDTAFLIQAAHVLRGVGYAKLDAATTDHPASVPVHAGLAPAYAHVTAPLRRLADRHANEIVLAQCDGVEPPEWARAPLERLVTTMEEATRRDADVERAVVDAVVVDKNQHGVIVQLPAPAVVAPLVADVPLGERVAVVVVAVDPVARRVELAPADATG